MKSATLADMRANIFFDCIVFLGYRFDLKSAVENHVMNRTKYCKELNNCQHYAAMNL
jgi:hypothetical protein